VRNLLKKIRSENSQICLFDPFFQAAGQAY